MIYSEQKPDADKGMRIISLCVFALMFFAFVALMVMSGGVHKKETDRVKGGSLFIKSRN